MNKRRLKIILAGPSWPYRGGIAEFSNRLAMQFSNEGHDIGIVTFRLQYPGILFPGKTQYTDSQAPAGLSIRRLINSVNPLNWVSTGLKIRREKPDLLVLRYWLPFMAPCLGTIARIARSNRHTKAVCVFDNVVPHEKRPGDKILTSFFSKSIDGGVVMAKSVMEDLKNFNSEIPVRLNPHPLYDNYGPPAVRCEALETLRLRDKRYILFFGFVRAYKGLDLLLKAFGDERLRNKSIKLIVAGEFYEDEKTYHELVSSLNIEDDVIFFSRFIRDEEIGAFFSIADLVVQPYKSATQSGVTQIAYHYGKPMLVTDVGGLKEIVPHGRCGYVVKPDPAEIAGSILDYFDNDRKEEFTKCVLEEKQKYTWDRMTEAVVECLECARVS